MAKLKVEIYGIPETAWFCPGCKSVISLLTELDIDYQFIPVIDMIDGDMQYDRPVITHLAKRIGCYPSLAIRYPVIFVNNKKQYDINTFKSTLISLGYDSDIIED